LCQLPMCKFLVVVWRSRPRSAGEYVQVEQSVLLSVVAPLWRLPLENYSKIQCEQAPVGPVLAAPTYLQPIPGARARVPPSLLQDVIRTRSAALAVTLGKGSLSALADHLQALSKFEHTQKRLPSVPIHAALLRKDPSPG